MDCKDLTIGDYVKYNGITKIVDAVYLYSVSVHDPSEEWSISEAKTYSVDDIEPIKLTEDILVKNGFRYTANVIGRHNCKCYELGQKGVYHMTISIYKNEITCELDKVDAMYMNVITNCVHELQHLLRLAGIEKSIEL